MKQILLLLTLLLAPLGIHAQEYAVYRVKGEAYQVVKQKKTTLQKGMMVNQKTILKLEPNSEVKLFNEKDREMVTFKNQCAGSIASLIASQKQARQSMTADYFAYIVKNMAGKGLESHITQGRTTAVFRDDADSLLYSEDSVMMPKVKQVPPASIVDAKSSTPDDHPINQFYIYKVYVKDLKK